MFRSWQATAVLALAAVALLWAGELSAESDFSPYVTADGTITVPEGFRDWSFLGTWIVAGGDEDGAAAGLHNVYTQPETVRHYRETGGFPDGAVLVKELLAAESEDMTTGYISRASEVEGWFVMIKDTQGRFADHPLWGHGWGWALFEVASPISTVTEDYEAECIPCHVPAEATDWIYVEGYPLLKQ